jgi:c-di-GMP-binding flagellar brake protein YcgR
MERRRQPERAALRREVQISRGGTRASGVTDNLSLGGAMIVCDADPPLRVGERITLSFALPLLDAPVRTEAEVRWINDIDRRCAGVQFLTGLRARETWALDQLIRDALAGEAHS